MSQQQFPEYLHRAFTEARLKPYRAEADSDLEACRIYFWNLDLCEALYPVLHCLEVTVRNEMDRCISSLKSNEWWFTDESLMGNYELEKVEKIQNRLDDGPIEYPTRGHHIAALPLGFWVSLFHKYYERNQRLWPTLFTSKSPRRPFPEVPKALRSRKHIYERLDDIRRLRNRVFHHEPIWNRTNLADDYETALEVIGWVEPELEDCVRDYCRFCEVRDRGWNSHSRWRIIEEKLSSSD